MNNQQTHVTTYTIMEYIKSHNLSLEDLSNLSSELNAHKDRQIANSLSAKAKFKIIQDCIGYYFDTNKALFNKEFNEFLSKVSI